MITTQAPKPVTTVVGRDAGTINRSTGHSTVGRALDETPFSLFHIRAMLAASAGFFTDAYDLFIIGTALALIKLQWHLSPSQVGLIGSATLVSTLIGALVFGRLADKLGRKSVYGVVALIMSVGALASAFSPNFGWLLASRLFLGLGIGGDYPISGVLMSEYANREKRGRMVSMVFSMQALGLVVGPMVAITLLGAGIDHAIAWRVMLGLGAVPALAVMYLRHTLPESPRFVEEVKGNAVHAAEAIKRFSGGLVETTASRVQTKSRSLISLLTSSHFLRLTLGTAGCWFLMDYAYYGNTISTPIVLKDVAPHSTLLQSAAWSLMVFAVFAVPGYILACATIDRIGHRRLQWMGFIAMAIAFASISLIPGIMTAVVPFLVIYGLSYFFTEFGPNTTTYVIPTEVFPVEARTTGHGIAAGVGKLGAFIGVFLFPVINANLGLKGSLLISTGAALAGAMLTTILPEPSGHSLEQLSELHNPGIAA